MEEGLPGRQDDTAVKGKEMMTEFSEKKMDISSQLENAFSKTAEDFSGSGEFRLVSVCFK